MADYYSILGVARTATQRQIREAYLRLAKANHPDQFPDPAKRSEADRRFQEINESFNQLKDEKLRREYDKTLDRQTMSPQQEAELYFKNAKLREEARDYAVALKYYYEAMRLDSSRSSYILGAGRILAKDRSKQRQAAELLEKVITQDPQCREAYVELGDLYCGSGLHSRARRVYQRGLQALGQDEELKSLLIQVAAITDSQRK
jgi:curved DNA-binding protein CbpA